MTRLRATLAVVLGATSLALSCAVYNDTCPPVALEVWGEFNASLDIRGLFIRQCEAPVGDFIADAMLAYDYGLLDGDQPVHPTLALINAGAIRDRVSCGGAEPQRDSIPKGPVTNQDIFQLLPFENTVVIVRLSGARLKEVLERAVSNVGEGGNLAQKGFFLQGAGEGGLQVGVDCSKTAQELSADGKAISTPGERIQSVCVGPVPQACLALEGTYTVAVVNYLVESQEGIPNDGFVVLHQSDVEIFETHVPLTEVVRGWLGVSHDPTYPEVEGRLTFTNCTNKCE